MKKKGCVLLVQLAAFALFAPWPTFGEQTTINVSNAMELQAALNSATGGETILLAAGDYGALTISGKNYASPVTLRSASPLEATFRTLTIKSSSNIRLDGVKVLYPAQASPTTAGPNLVTITGGSSVEFINGYVGAERVYDATHMVAITNSSNVLIHNSELTNAGRGITWANSTGVTITDNEIHRMTESPLRTTSGAGINGLTITGNHIYDMHKYPNEPGYLEGNWDGSHGSLLAIRGGGGMGADNILFANNHAHDLWLGWIQLYDGEFDQDYVYNSITIEGNLIYDNGGGTHMYSPGTSKVINGPIVIRHNTVISGNQDAIWTDPKKRFQANGSKQTFNAISSPGGIVENNVFITDVSLPSYARNNLLYQYSWNSQKPATNVEIVSSYPSDYIDTELFVSPLYAKGHKRTHQPGSAVDFTPQLDSIISAMSTTGGYIGAIPPGQAPAIQTASSVSQYGITWTFDKEYPAGQFANGDWWVVGPVTLVSITPEFTGARNGWEIDPAVGTQQGFDDRIPGFAASLVPPLPRTVDLQGVNAVSLVKAVSRTDSAACGAVSGSDRGCLQTASVLTVVLQPPLTDSFRPPYVHTGGDKSFHSASSLNASIFPNLPLIPGALDPSYVVSKMNRVQLDHFNQIVNVQYMHPKDYMKSYGAGYTGDLGAAALVLTLDYSSAEKRPALIAYAQAGIDLYAMLENGRRWNSNGGHGSGRKLPILLAGLILDDPGMLSIGTRYPAASVDAFAEDTQTFYTDENPPYADAPNPGCYSALPAEYGSPYARYAKHRHYAALDDFGGHGEDHSCDTEWSSYWTLNSHSWVGEALATHLLGLTDEWNHQAYFDHLDRYIETQGFAGSWGNTFNDNMWAAYRGSVSPPPPPENRAPVANDMDVTTLQDTPVALTLAASDPDGDALSFTVASQPSNGTLSGTAPDLTYTPDAGFTGTDSFTFSANDGEFSSNIATVSISVVPPGSNLQGHWAFTGDFTDQSGLDRHGTPLNGASISGGALDLDGVDDRVDLGDFSVSGSQITLAAWVKVASYQRDMRILAKAVDANTQRWLLEIDDGPNVFGFRVQTGNGQVRLTGGSAPLDQWVHVAGVYDGAQMRLYKDGVLAASQAHSGDIAAGLETVLIGDNDPTGSRPFHGSLDEVRIYDRALAQEEIQALVDGGLSSTTDTNPPSVPGNLQAAAISSSEVALSWEASTDDTGVAGYEIFRDGVFLSSVAGLSYNDAGLTADTAYAYEVQAKDAAGNVSPKSSPVMVTTLEVPPPPPGCQAISNASELQAAISGAAGGECIELASGSYGDFTISGRNMSSEVHILAAQGATPVFSDINVANSSNWRISGVQVKPRFSSGADGNTAVSISGSDLIFENSVVNYADSIAGWTVNDWLSRAGNGISLGGSNLTIRDNIVQNVDHAIHGSADNSVISGNSVINFRGDGARILGDFVTFEYNLVKNVFDVDDNHDDGFQSWSVGPGGVGTGEVVGVVIRNNTFLAYDDPSQPLKGSFQGIGLFDGMFRDWVIENNVIATSHWHGISMYGAVNSRIVNNTVIDLDAADSLVPWVKIFNHKDGTPSQGSVIRNNLAPTIGADAGVTADHNIEVSDPGSYYAAPPLDLRLKSGSPAIDSGSADQVPANDRDGNVRPQGAGYDIGAYEDPSGEVQVAAPSVDNAPSITNQSPLTLGGGKEAGTSIWINGVEAVAADSLTNWSADVALVEGENLLAVTAKDGAGNESSSVNVSVELDTVPPVIVVTSSSETSSANYTIEYAVDGATKSSAHILVEGVNTLTITETDLAGNTATADFEVTYTPLGTPPPPGCQDVSNAAELQSALDGAAGGECIELASDNYGSLNIDNKTFSDYVTLRSADGNKGGVFESVSISNSQYVRIDNVRVASPSNGAAASPIVAFRNGSQHVELINSEVHGLVDGDFSGHRGLYAEDAADVRFENNYIHDVSNGSVFITVSNLQLIGNTFEDLGNDDVKLISVNGGVIENNFGATRKYPSEGAHLDFIQGQGGSSRNLAIRGNVSLPQGSISQQGIFLSDVTYDNILIENNVVYVALIRGINVSDGSTNVTIRHNTVLDVPENTATKASLIFSPAGAVVENNIQSSYPAASGPSGTNLTLQHQDPEEAHYFNDYYQNAATGYGIIIEDLRPVETSPAHDQVGAFQRIYEILDGGGSPPPPPENRAPVANDMTVGTLQDTPVALTLAASDPDGDALSFAVASQPSNGTLSGTAPNLTYTPEAGFTGTDSFTFSAQDGELSSNVATVSISVVLPGSDLQGHWTFTGDFTDQSGFERHGTPLNGASISGGALDLDGADDRVGLGNFSVSGGQLTLAAWVKASSYQRDMRILAKAVDASTQRWLLEIDDGPNVFGFRVQTGNGQVRLTGGSAPLDQWVHVAGVYDGAQMRLYKDGVLAASQAHSGDIAAGLETVLIGDNDPTGSRPFHGSLDEVRIYDRALAQEEIQALVDAGLGQANRPPVITSGITHDAVDVDPAAPGLQIYGGALVAYAGEASDPDGDELSWEWHYSIDGGDKVLFSSGTGMIAEAVFDYAGVAAPKSYRWTLRVTDGKGGVAETLLDVEVVVAPPAAPRNLRFIP